MILVLRDSVKFQSRISGNMIKTSAHARAQVTVIFVMVMDVRQLSGQKGSNKDREQQPHELIVEMFAPCAG